MTDKKTPGLELKKGGKYNFKHQGERLVYMGESQSNGIWHQFALVSDPGKVWAEIREDDFHMIEATKTPVDIVIDKFGSATAVADALGIQRSNVTHWQSGGGEIPFKHHSKLLKAAEAKEIELKREQLEPDNLA